MAPNEQKWNSWTSPKKSHHDLLRNIDREQSEGNLIILLIDANTSRHDKNGIVNQLKLQQGLIEAIETKHETPTYQRGTTQIDFILCSPQLRPFIRYNTIQPFGEICGSDHKIMIIDIDLPHLKLQKKSNTGEK